MHKIVLAEMLFLISFIISSNEKRSYQLEEKFSCVLPIELGPEFPQGIDSLRRFIRSKFVIPELIVKSEKRIYGTIIIEFKVDYNGILSGFKIVKSITPELDSEVIRVFKL